MIGQGIVLMVAGMVIVYAFLYLLIVVSQYSSRLVSHFDYLVADCEQNRKQKASAVVQNDVVAPKDTTSVTAPVPGSVLRISVSEGQIVAKDDELLVLDVMKMETPITAPCAGRVSIRVAVMDKVSTGDALATIGQEGIY